METTSRTFYSLTCPSLMPFRRPSTTPNTFSPSLWFVLPPPVSSLFVTLEILPSPPVITFLSLDLLQSSPVHHLPLVSISVPLVLSASEERVGKTTEGRGVGVVHQVPQVVDSSSEWTSLWYRRHHHRPLRPHLRLLLVRPLSFLSLSTLHLFSLSCLLFSFYHLVLSSGSARGKGED